MATAIAMNRALLPVYTGVFRTQGVILVKAALAHVQFETIHPFLDGNGRLGRLLITLLLCDSGILSQPLLYISYYFKLHRQYYYELLNEVRVSGEWEKWLDFFADAVIASARQAIKVTRSLHKLAETDRQAINNLGRAAASVLQIHQAMLAHPIAGARNLVTFTGLSPATANKALRQLEKLGIVEELTRQKRNRLFRYRRYMDLLNAGMELPE